MTPFEQRLIAALPRVRGYATKLCRDPDRAEDMTQDTALRALKAQHTFDGSNMEAWLLTICRNAYFSERSTKKRNWQEDPDDLLAGCIVDPAPTPEQHLLFIDAFDLVARRMSEPHQATLLLWINGHSEKEMAAATGVSYGTVKSRVHRARTLITEDAR